LTLWQCQTNFLADRVRADERYRMIKPSPFRYFKTSPEIIGAAVMMCVRFPLRVEVSAI